MASLSLKARLQAVKKQAELAALRSIRLNHSDPFTSVKDDSDTNTLYDYTATNLKSPGAESEYPVKLEDSTLTLKHNFPSSKTFTDLNTLNDDATRISTSFLNLQSAKKRKRAEIETELSDTSAKDASNIDQRRRTTSYNSEKKVLQLQIAYTNQSIIIRLEHLYSRADHETAIGQAKTRCQEEARHRKWSRNLTSGKYFSRKSYYRRELQVWTGISSIPELRVSQLSDVRPQDLGNGSV